MCAVCDAIRAGVCRARGAPASALAVLADPVRAPRSCDRGLVEVGGRVLVCGCGLKSERRTRRARE